MSLADIDRAVWQRKPTAELRELFQQLAPDQQPHAVKRMSESFTTDRIEEITGWPIGAIYRAANA